MAAPLPTADDVIAIVQQLITDLGVEAFKTDGRIQLYSGPRAIVIKALIYYIKNQGRALKEAARLATVPIDHTKVGKFLEAYEDDQNVYKFFNKHYGSLSSEAFEHADKVMRFASREFIKASYGFAATAVCGAGLNKIFFQVELPEINDNPRIDNVNGIPAQLVRDFYSLDPYEAFRLICISELIEARKYAARVGTFEAIQDYKERRKFFLLERQDTAKFLPAVSPTTKADIKLRKRQILATYSLAVHSALIAGGTSIPITPSKTKRAKRKSPAPIV